MNFKNCNVLNKFRKHYYKTHNLQIFKLLLNNLLNKFKKLNKFCKYVNIN